MLPFFRKFIKDYSNKIYGAKISSSINWVRNPQRESLPTKYKLEGIELAMGLSTLISLAKEIQGKGQAVMIRILK